MAEQSVMIPLGTVAPDFSLPDVVSGRTLTRSDVANEAISTPRGAAWGRRSSTPTAIITASTTITSCKEALMCMWLHPEKISEESQRIFRRRLPLPNCRQTSESTFEDWRSRCNLRSKVLASG